MTPTWGKGEGGRKKTKDNTGKGEEGFKNPRNYADSTDTGLPSKNHSILHSYEFNSLNKPEKLLSKIILIKKMNGFQLVRISAALASIKFSIDTIDPIHASSVVAIAATCSLFKTLG